MKTDTILISGATGLIGSKLIKTLHNKGYTNIAILTRKKNLSLKFDFPITQIQWNPSNNDLEDYPFKSISTVFNLAGDNIASSLWTAKKKKLILDSRVQSANLLISSFKDQKIYPKKMINSSAIGIYGSQQDTILNEQSKLGKGYLADVCQKWEQAALSHSISTMQTFCLRTGLVLAKNGGALEKMLLPFKLGLGGPLGSGQQYMSWIHMDDLIAQFIYIMENNCTNNIYNAVSPTPVTNKLFSQTLAKVLHRPCLFPVPAFILKLCLGELSQLLLDSQRVQAQKFIDDGFTFAFSNLEQALQDILIPT